MSFIECYEQAKDKELEYLLEFLFQLTIYGREIHRHDSSEKQFVALSQLNEINHRVLNRVIDLGSMKPWSDREYLVRMVPHHVQLGKGIESGVGNAASRAFEKYNA